MRQRGSRGARAAVKLGWGAADQALSSLTNFLLALMVARSVTAEGFGVFALLFATFLLVLGVSRSLSSDVLVTRFSSVTPAEWRPAVSSATGVAAVTGTIAGAAVVVVALLLGASSCWAAIALAVFLPGLLVQDCWRFAFIARGAPRSALVNDAIAALALVPALAVLAALHVRAIGAFTLVWGAAATLAALAGCVQAGVRPRLRSARVWTGTHRDLALPYTGDFLSYLGGAQLVTYLLATFGGVSAAAALRGAGVLLGPLNVVFMGIGNIAVVEGVSRRSSRRLLLMWALSISCLLALSALVWTAGAALLPASVGHAVLGATWKVARPVVLPLGLSMAASGFAAGAISGLRSLGVARRSLFGRLGSTALAVVAASAGSPFGVLTAVAAMAAGQWAAAAAVWWPLFLRSLPSAATQTPRPADTAALRV